MPGLASRWATDPELVEKAEKQDSSVKKETKSSESKWSSTISSEKGKSLEYKWATPVTSKKGKPLASRWADAEDDGESDKKSITKREPNNNSRKSSPRSPKAHHHQEHRNNNNRNQHLEDINNHFDRSLQIENEGEDEKVELSSEAKNFASRLGAVSDSGALKPKIHFKKERGKKVVEDEWEDEIDGDSEEAEEVEEADKVKPEPPTKAAKDFASRLGISIGDKDQVRNKREQERQRLNNERINARREWDNGKQRHNKSNDHNSYQHNRNNDHGSHHNTNNDHNSNHQNQPRRDRREITKRAQSHHKELGKISSPVKKIVIDEETRQKQIEADKKLEEYFDKGIGAMDWADFETDDY